MVLQGGEQSRSTVLQVATGGKYQMGKLNHLTVKSIIEMILWCFKIILWTANNYGHPSSSRKAAEYLDDKQIEEDMEVPIDR